MVLTVGCALSCPDVAWAGEASKDAEKAAKQVDLKARMKALVAEALKSGDLWTAIQADAFASQKLGVRSSGVLGGAEILGDPLFAFPNRLGGFAQRGDLLAVASGNRFYRLAADGHPLGVSIPLTITPSALGLSTDGTYVALVERQRIPELALKLSVRTVATGAEVFSATQTILRGDYLYGDVQVADDGSAVVVGLLNDDGNDVPRLAVLRASGKHVMVRGYFRPIGIANGGNWGLAEPQENRSADTRVYALLQGGMTMTCQSAVMGPGVAAVIPQEQTTVQIVGHDGTQSALPLPRPLGTSGRVTATAEWLLIGSGWAKVDENEVDLLGNPVGPGEPYVTWFYRWSDLAKDPAKAVPVLTVNGLSGISTLVPTTVFVGWETDVRVVDLTQTTPEAKPLMTTVAKVRFIEPSHGRMLLWLRENKYQVIDESGADLWNGVAPNGVVIHDPWYAHIRHDDGHYEWIKFGLAAERQVSRLQVPAGSDYEIQLDRYHRHLIATRSRREWVEFSPTTGKVIPAIGLREFRPQMTFRESGRAVSQFSVQAARLVPRLDPPVPEEPSTRWNPRDAWRVNGSLLVIDHHGQVYISGRKRGTHQLLGNLDYPNEFAQTLAGDLVITNEEQLARARFAAGPILATEGQGIGQRSQPLPEGPWRVKSTFFVPPRGSSMMWDAQRCGFVPVRLRSPPPPATNLLVVTDSLVIDVDPVLGKQLGVIDKSGQRDLER
jgi:hypothetical protein